MSSARVRIAVLAVVGATAIGVSPARAQSSAPPVPVSAAAADVRQVREDIEQLKKEFDALRQEYERRLGTLEQRLGALAGPSVIEPAPAASAQDPAVAAAVPQDPAPAPAAGQAYAAGSKVFNPDISAIGNFLGAAGKNPMGGESSLSLTEAEVALQAVVDPYAKADFFLAAGPEGVEVEEGYITFTTLPAGLLLKAGKMRAQFGKVNTMHTHILPWADRPLVMRNLLGGEEGLADSGMSVSKLIPNGFMFLEGIGEVYQGASDVFQTDRRSRLMYLGRLRGYRDLTESTNLDLGVTYSHGPTALDVDATKNLIGLDMTFRWRPLRRAIYQRFVGRTELIWSRQALPLAQHAFGFYSSADYQFARRWYAGARIDRSGRALDASQIDKGGAFYVTFWPTEFSQIRTQYRRTSYAEGASANEVLFQINFSIGAHGAHVF